MTEVKGAVVVWPRESKPEPLDNAYIEVARAFKDRDTIELTAHDEHRVYGNVARFTLSNAEAMSLIRRLSALVVADGEWKP